MSLLLHMIGKLGGRSAGELRVRAAQKLHIMAERSGWSSLTRLLDDAAFFKLLDARQFESVGLSADVLLQHFRTRTTPRFFPAFYEKQETIAELRSHFSSQAVIDGAWRASEGHFDLLGLRDLYFGSPINWHLEPVSGVVAPNKHWSQISYLDAAQAGDKKITWELNRHAYFATLGRAYWRTKDELYAQSFVAHINSWIDANPPKRGINWASSLEVALRSVSWLWALYFFKDSEHLTPTVYLRILKLLYLHGRHIETYLSTYFSPNTHLTGEALGLFYLGTLMPEFACADRWRTKGRRILLGELDRHVRADGVYFEQSSYYHRYTTDFYTHLLILLRRNKEPVEDHLEAKLLALLDHLMYITRPDGTTPLFGDDDGGRLVTLDDSPCNNFRAALATGAVLFGRSDYKYVAGAATEEVLWLLGHDGLQAFDSLEAHSPGENSQAFKNGGYYVMRDGWSRDANYLLLDCGPHGSLRCGHAHADALSFELASGGRTLLVDPGTYTYTGSKEMRNWFRSSLAHNTLTVDLESSSIPDNPFSWKTIAACEPVNWISRPRFDYVEGKHDGYQRLPDPVQYTRCILFLKRDYWVLRDRIASSGEHRLDLWFHFDSRKSPRIERVDGQAQVMTDDGKAGLDIISFAKDGQWTREDGWVSHCYGEKSMAPVCVFSTIAHGNEELVSFLLPKLTASLPSRRVREIEAIGGRAFEVADENGLDIVMIQESNARRPVEMARLASDFEWTWARFSSDSGHVPDELVLLGGQTLELEGKEILKSARQINYLVASRVGDQFRLETDDGVLDLGLPIKDFDSAFSNLKSQI